MTNFKDLYRDFSNLNGGKEQVRECRNAFRSEFESHFSAAGFSRHPGGSLIPEHDMSVLFTGSTISTFKPIFMEGKIPDQGLFMLQHCLRTQNANRIQDETFNPAWSSYFSSTGTLSRYADLDNASHMLWSFLTDRLGIEPENIRVNIKSSDHDLLNYWTSVGLESQLVRDTKEPVYYTHKFGIEGVAGRNCNVAIRSQTTGEYRDIGNIIVIETEQQKLAVELAYGVETAISRILDLPTPIHAAPISEFLPTASSQEVKIADAVAASTLIVREGVKPVATNRGRVLRRYLQGVAELLPHTDMTVGQLMQASEHFERQCYGDASDAGHFIAEYISNYQQMKSEPGPKRGDLNKKITQSILKL
jgi:alanyl-tRNA synthetase